MIFWAVLITLVIIPLLALTIEVGYYSFARAGLAKATDAAELATAIEIDRGSLWETG